MIRISQRSKLALSVIAASIALPSVAQAAFVEDSKASLELRNMYLNRDARDGTISGQSYGETWAQGFIGKFESGYTGGTVGVGIDALAMLGVKLDSSKGNTIGNMLPVGADGEPDDEYSELGLTGKVRVSKTEMKVGTLQPLLPVVQYNNTRLLPGTYTGGMLTSQEVGGLILNAGRLTEFNARDSSNNEEFASNVDNFDFAGGSYAFNPQLTASYYYGDLDNTYKQHFAGLVHTLPLGEGLSLRSDLRYFNTSDQGDAAKGVIDNDMYQGMFTLGVGAHKFGVGYQGLSGDGDFPFINGGDPFSINLVTYQTFTVQETDAWQVRYDYDFASLGVPGLTFMTRYVNGDNLETAAGDDGKAWERDTDIVYTLQSGSLKGLRFHLRNVTYRADDVSGTVGRDVDENRVIVSYTLPLL